MVLPRWYAALVGLPIMFMGTTLFAMYRHLYPINDRPKWLYLITGVMLVLYDILTLTVGDDDVNGDPCPPSTIIINVAIIPLFILMFLFRGIVLLFKYEITENIAANHANTNNNHNGAHHNHYDGITTNGLASSMDGMEWLPPSSPTTDHQRSHPLPAVPMMDAALMASVPSSPTAASSSSASASPSNRLSLSWYTKNFHMMKASFLGRIAAVQLIIGSTAAIIIGLGQGSIPCTEVSVWWTLQFALGNGFALIEALALLVVVILLWRHSRDGLHIKQELMACVIIVIGYCVIGMPIIVYGIQSYDTEKVSTQSLGNVLGIISIWYPLWLAYQHIRHQRAIASDVQRVATLTELLAIPIAVQYFAAFLAANFASESISFTLRARALQAIVIPGASSSTNVTMSTPTHASATVFSPRHAAASSPPTKSLAIDTTTTAHHPAINGQSLVSSLSTTLKEAYAIYRLFIVPGAPFEVNIAARTRQQITLQLQSLTTAVAAAIRSSPAWTKRHTAAVPAGGVGATPTTATAVTVISIPSPTAATSADHHHHHADDSANIMLHQSIQSLYNGALTEIEQLMTTNYFVRFRLSEQYAALLLQLGNQPQSSAAAGSGGGAGVIGSAMPRSPMIGGVSRMSRVSQPQSPSPKGGGVNGTAAVPAAAVGNGGDGSRHSTPSLNSPHVAPAALPPPLTIASPKLTSGATVVPSSLLLSSPIAGTSSIVMAWSPRMNGNGGNGNGRPPVTTSLLTTQSSTSPAVSQASQPQSSPSSHVPPPQTILASIASSSSTTTTITPSATATAMVTGARSNAYMVPSSPVLTVTTRL